MVRRVEIRRIPVIRTSAIVAFVVLAFVITWAFVCALLEAGRDPGDPFTLIATTSVPMFVGGAYVVGVIVLTLVIYNWISRTFAGITLEVEVEDEIKNEQTPPRDT